MRPTWFLWEEGEFWILTDPAARLGKLVRERPEVALVVDECDLTTGLVRQVIARGQAEVRPFDLARALRKLRRYLGADEEMWDPRFRSYVQGDPAERGVAWVCVRPERMVVKDLSYVPA